MKKIQEASTIILILFFCANLKAQIEAPGKPFFLPINEKSPIEIYELEADLSYPKSVGENLLKKRPGVKTIPVSFSPETHGEWVALEEINRKAWRFAVRVKGAPSLSLVLKPFKLAEGAKLFFYDAEHKQVIGAITSKNNKEFNTLAISLIKSDLVYCELQIPDYMESYGGFSIAKIKADYLPPENKLKSVSDERFDLSADCHENVNCHSFAYLEYQKNAVIRIKTGEWCSATLVNNLANDLTPYVLTAAHCVYSNEMANETVFYFQYESADCNSTDVEPLTISGATLVAAGDHELSDNDSLDFALLKLSEAPPLHYDVFYSGWDATNTPSQKSYVIHHPNGDIKKIAMDYDPTLTGTSGRYIPKTHWRVKNYEVGSSEVGSSGSGLVNQDNRLVGTLSTGNSVCTKDIEDRYQKLYHSWEDFADPTYQLKRWLDPNNTGKRTCNGLLPYGKWVSLATAILNYDTLEIPVAKEQALGSGYLAGHNYQSNKLFAEKFSVRGTKYLVGAGIDIAMALSNAPEQYVNFKVWEGGETPGKVLYEKKVLVSFLEDHHLHSKIALYQLAFDSTISVTNTFYFGYEINYTNEVFAVKNYKQSANNNTAFTKYENSWRPLVLDNVDYPSNMALSVYAFDLNSSNGVLPDTAKWGNVHLYPNPATEQVQVYFKDALPTEMRYAIYSISGQLVGSDNIKMPARNHPIPLNLETGLYFIRLTINDNFVKTIKLQVK